MFRNFLSIAVVSSVSLLSLVTVSTRAMAQSSTAAAAEALFEQGRKLMAAGDYVHACPKFVESQRLDPASGTLLNIGACYEKLGKTASAWAAFKEAASVAKRDGHQARVEYALQHIAKLQPTLSYLTVVVKSRVKGVKVWVDDVPLEQASWGVALPVDPGTHKVRAEAPGYASWTTQVEIGAKADKKQLVVPELQPANDQQKLRSGSSDSEQAPPEQRSSGGSTLAYVLGGVGVVGLAAGTYFGLTGLSKWSERNDHCDETGCDDQGLQAGKEADTYGYLSDVGFGVGVVGIGAAAYLLLSGPSLGEGTGEDAAKVRVVPQVGASSAGVSVGGRW